MNASDFFAQLGAYRSLKLLLAIRKWGKGRIIRTWQIASDADLGEGVRLDEGVVIHRRCRVGAHTYLRNGSKLWHGSEIGAYCSIGENVLIGTPEHPKQYLSTSPVLYQEAPKKPDDPWPPDDVLRPAFVENDVWIGNNAVVRGGVRVATGAIVGTGAVVTHDVEPYAIVAGIPARTIGRRFDDVLSHALLESRWWEIPREELLVSDFLFTPSLLLDTRKTKGDLT